MHAEQPLFYERTKVIVRVSSSAVPVPLVGAYVDQVQRSLIPAYQGAPGLVSVVVMQRPFSAFVEVLMLSLWVTEKALNQFLDKQGGVDVVRRPEGVIDMEPRNFEFVSSYKGNVPYDQDLQG